MYKFIFAFLCALCFYSCHSQLSEQQAFVKDLNSACLSIERNNLGFNSGAWILQDNKGRIRVSASGNYNCDTKFLVGSVSKNLTAIATMQQINQGNLNLNTTVGKVLSSSPQNLQNITVDQLLSHKSGITVNARVLENDPNLNRFRNKSENDLIEAQILKLASSSVGRPGFYSYNSANYLILAMMIRKVNNAQVYGDVLKASVFDKANMTRSGILDNLGDDQNSGVSRSQSSLLFAGGAGGIHSTPRDMILFNRAVKDGTLIPKSSFQQMLQLGYGFEDINQTSASHGGSIDGMTAYIEFSLSNNSFFAGFANGGTKAKGGNGSIQGVLNGLRRQNDPFSGPELSSSNTINNGNGNINGSRMEWAENSFWDCNWSQGPDRQYQVCNQKDGHIYWCESNRPARIRCAQGCTFQNSWFDMFCN